MPWLLALHIAALLCWCGALLYLPTVIVARSHETGAAEAPSFPLARMVFTYIATPAALVSVMAGVALFLVGYTIAVWLILKLTLVSALVICHVLTGQFIFFVEKESPRKYATGLAASLSIFSASFIGGILWLVLAKPF